MNFHKFQRVRKKIKRFFPAFVGGIVVVAIIWISMPQTQEQEDKSFPVFTFLMQSFEEGDLGKRVEEAIVFSLVPKKITFFGQGLGSIGQGKPGEFGIRSIWSESGVFWGAFMLLAFLGIIMVLLFKACRCFLAAKVLDVSIYATPALLLIFAILAGLTSAFELSTGLLLGCSIAVTTRSSRNAMGWFRLPFLYRRIKA